MRSAAGFVRAWLLCLGALALLVAGANFVVNPYEVFGLPRIAGINQLKPATKNYSLLAKTYQVARAHPATILIGSSSTHIGIDAGSAPWPPDMQPVYNYGIPGGYDTFTSFRTLQEALFLGGVRHAVVFLDFQNFFVPQAPGDGRSEAEQRFHLTDAGAPNRRREIQVLSDSVLSLLTLNALLDSTRTVAGQRFPGLLNLAADGSSTESDFAAAARFDGMHDLFAQKDAFESQRALQLSRSMAKWSGKLPNLSIVQRIIDLCRNKQVRLTLVITPHHVDALELYWRDGLWPRVEQLKTEMAALAADADVPLWDFMDYSAFNTEAVPPEGDRRTATQWFWESTHFKKRLGTIMVRRMFAATAPEYGMALTPANVTERNAAVRHERQRVICEETIPVLTSLADPPPAACGQQAASLASP